MKLFIFPAYFDKRNTQVQISRVLFEGHSKSVSHEHNCIFDIDLSEKRLDVIN